MTGKRVKRCKPKKRDILIKQIYRSKREISTEKIKEIAEKNYSENKTNFNESLKGKKNDKVNKKKEQLISEARMTYHSFHSSSSRFTFDS